MEPDPETAVEWLEKAAGQGLPRAMGLLSRCLRAGIGVQRDEREALTWLQKAAGLGDGDAMHVLGQWYRDGAGALPKDREKALDWLRRAAEAGCTGAAEDLRALEADADAPQARKKGLLGRLFGS